ncbi:hypothetical protein JMA_41010 (plasmid) [Jeotgalibacillus malaysiensis]|uniref:Bacterial Ig domain-containing protein n=1 Tax=Jeotgalibacillus malaysiensis TaxID=1508404 RepID=A0A0B5AZQ6_9BACL|nr:hypothetical protein [Jeotgalibacillus malaysiensis]AJD93419.1 hypothetical protein JMA_41010 [Jeotgalibacillus malaysiensis]
MKKKRKLLAIVLLTTLVPVNALAESMVITLPESMSQTQNRTVTVPSNALVNNVTVNTGNVSHSQNGSQLLLYLTNGSVSSSRYNSSKYSKYISKTMTSSSNSFPSSDSYNDGTYSGTYYKDGSSYVYSGTYTPSDSRTQTDSRSTSPGGSSGSLPSSIPYNSGGYSGTLYGGGAYVSSGSYSPADSRSQSDSRTYRCGNSYVWSDSSRSWSYGGTYAIDSIASSIPYNSGGYSGTLYQGGVLSSCSAPAPSLSGSYNGERRNSNAGYTTINYSGTVTKPASADTRVWTVNYSGTVTRPSSDTRIWAQNYSGYAYAGGYDSYYQYTATINYDTDSENPDGSLSANPTNWTNGDVTITLSDIKDFGIAGVKGVYLPNGNFVTGSSIPYTVSTNGTYSFIIEDKVGNRTTKSISIGNIDKTLPTATLTQSPTNFTNQNVVLSLSNILDAGGSDLKQVVMPDGKIETSFENKMFTVSENGTYSFEIWDNAGNKTVKTINVNNIDKSAPTATLTPSTTNLTNQNVIFTISNVQDNGVSGLKGITLPNGNLVTGTSATYTVTENGVYTFLVEDNAGNRWTETVNVTNIDKELPLGKVKLDTTAWTNQSFGLELIDVKDDETGVKRVQLPDGTWKNHNASETYRYVVDKNGVYTYRIEDNAGNITVLNQSVTNIDKNLPAGTFVYDTSKPSDGLIINLNATDDMSGIKEITLPDGRIVSASKADFSVKKGGSYDFIVEDKAGNRKTLTAVVDSPRVSVVRDKLELVVTVTSNYTAEPVTKRKETLQTWNSKSFRVPVTKDDIFTFQTNDGGVLSDEVTFVVDNFFTLSLPQIDVTYDKKWTNKNVVLNLSVYSIGGTPIVSTTLPDNTTSNLTNFNYTISENGMYTFVAKDALGKLGYQTVVVKNIDKKTPLVELTTPTDWVNRDIPIDIKVTNN